jgi:signal transduction histidine kinase
MSDLSPATMSSAEMQTFLRDLVRTPVEQFDLQRTLVALLNYAASHADAQSAYLKRATGDAGRAIVATSGEGGVIALEGTVATHAVPVISHGVQIGTLVLLRDEPISGLNEEQQQLLQSIADLIAVALRRETADEEIRRSQQLAAEAVDAKYRLIGGLSTNLKDSLSVAAGYLQLLDMQEELSLTQHDYVTRGRRSIQKAVSLINELGALARAESGDLSIELDSVNLVSFVRGLITNYHQATQAKRILLNADTPVRTPTVYTDSNYISDILDALLSNAVRYTPDGGVISVRVEQRDGRRMGDPPQWVCVSVQDTGPGVLEPDSVFEEIPRVEKPSTQVGFRLVICRRIARLMGGDLTVESSPGRGATFTLWLPLPRPRA